MINIRYFVSIMIITTLLTGCAGIPGKSVKLEDYPEITFEDANNVSLSYKHLKSQSNIPNYKKFDSEISAIFRYGAFKIRAYQKSSPTLCFIELSTKTRVPLVSVTVVNYLVSFVTLFVIPSYRQIDYQANATLISTKDNKVLKTYELKDKVHEVWSSLWMLSWFVVEPNKYAPNAEYPKDAKQIMVDKISKALTRQIVHDANQFPECKRDDKAGVTSTKDS